MSRPCGLNLHYKDARDESKQFSSVLRLKTMQTVLTLQRRTKNTSDPNKCLGLCLLP